VTGTIVIWRLSFGFIRPDDGSPDVFLRGRLFRTGDRVTFTAVPNDRRPGQLVATDVEVIGYDPPPTRRASVQSTTVNWQNFHSAPRRRAA
jgi:cold shock CspA family protein